MSVDTILICFFFLHSVNPQFQINLYWTDPVSEDENVQHDCLYVPAYIKNQSDPRQIISYCMGELSSKFHIKENNIDQKFTFDELSKQNITSQQLYLWSAPIDLIEQYQLYLNSRNITLSTKIYYNCTLPYFGSKCQYVLYDYKSYHSSLDEMIHDYYRYNRYEPSLFTCYIHLECNRGPSPSCLDWTEICDGKVDCIDGRYDEEHCWQLETHECNDNEYQCSDGQCVPKSFFNDDPNNPDCLEKSDEAAEGIYHLDEDNVFTEEPTFRSEDTSCIRTKNRKIKFDIFFSFLTSSCIDGRHNLLSQVMFSIKPKAISDECWTAMKCMIHMPIKNDAIYSTFCDRAVHDEIINKTCPDIIYVPAFPLVFGHIYLVYDKNILIHKLDHQSRPDYICYNTQHFHVSDYYKKVILSNNDTCLFYNSSKSIWALRRTGWIETHIYLLYQWLQKNTASIYSNSKFVNKSMIYKCMNWPKYISERRLFDDVADCYYIDDENISIFDETSSTKQNLNYFKCKTINTYIPNRLVRDGRCHCRGDDPTYCDDENLDISYARHIISFQTICDGLTHLLPKSIDDQNETDETNCEQWPLIHIYNRCDGFWHNLNGSDELNCDSSLLNCSANNHICVSPITNELMCLPIEKANDGIIHCLGAADEPKLCSEYSNRVNFQTFYCKTIYDSICIEAKWICSNEQICENNEDKQACKSVDRSEVSDVQGICVKDYESHGSDIAKVLCRHFFKNGQRWRIYFTLDQRRNSIQQNVKHENSAVLSSESRNESIEYYQQRCHRGLDLEVWLDKTKNLTRNVCLCPPSYYGDICQYQNQRISLTLQFRVTSDSVKIPFNIIISLIDDSNERIIHSSEQFTYLSMKHCQRKSNIYLLYSTRPKDEMKQYLIHIDIYEKETLNYRGSLIKFLNFSFLPVHRLAFQMDIPGVSDNLESYSDNQCINGKYITYFNDPNNKTFCQCENGWSGKYCTIKYNCMCSSDSLCIGKLANNRFLCVCPLHKMGSQCLIENPVCRNNKSITCFNDGQCIPSDDYGISTKNFTCICRKGFFGDRCEISRTKLIMTFNKNITLPPSILIHFIEIKLDGPPIRTTSFKTIPFGQDSIIVYWSLPFHIVFVELSNQIYYLIHIQKIYNQSSTIEKTLNSSDRCLNINELFNETILNSSFLRRIKSYHLPCQINSSKLSCFYDEIHFCLCQQLDEGRVSNCFEFNHNMSLYCFGKSGCENGGKCFQEYTNCPRISICQCPICFYGTRCQLSTNAFSLSLDAILGYHIQTNIKISHQPSAVLISLILTLIITLLGIINGILSLITFKNKITHETGCGIYLLSSSIITLLTMISFLLKFVILLVSQMGLIQNRLFLNIQCHSMDFILRFCLTMDQWLTAFVAIERAFIIIKRANFNKNKSKSIAKWTITGLILITILTNIQDPIYRHLFDENEEDEKRIWCIVKYPSVIRIINLIINILHFIIPFILNLISAILIIIMSTRQQVAIQKKQKYSKILNEQIEKHKNLLIGPSVLIILGIPRLIISITSDCMKSSSDSWLFLVGYFISLIPPLLTFILFVLPSTTYRQAFKKAVSQYRNIIKIPS